MMKTIQGAENTMKDLTSERNKEHAVYKEESGELQGAIKALSAALGVLKNLGKKNPEYTLVQLRAATSGVQQALAMADALGLGSTRHKGVMGFLQGAAPEVPMQDYSFHLSDDIIDMLEELEAGFRKESNELDEKEVKAKAIYDMTMQDKTDLVGRKKTEYSQSGKKRAAIMEEISELSDQHTGISAQLADELSAIIAALGIIKGKAAGKAESLGMKLAETGVAVRRAHEVARNDADMEAIEAETESDFKQVPSFIQVEDDAEEPGDDGRLKAAELLARQGMLLHSSMLSSLAEQIKKKKNDPFAKIKTLIQELIGRLMQQAKEEATQKGWCDSSLAEGAAKRDRNADDVAEINDEMAR